MTSAATAAGKPKNLIYAQSGGATAVINVTARALLEEARRHPDKIGRVFAANGGITGVLTEKIFDITDATDAEVLSIENEPGAFFGTCRYKLDNPATNDAQYKRLFDVFQAHNIGYFFYNGGNDSQDTTNRIAAWCRAQGLDVQCIGVPKTVDNDLAGTDSCPGFGSVAKYIAIAVTEVAADLLSICGSSTKVFVFETMGRDAGWIAGAAGLIKRQESDPPHLVLLPEVPLDKERFLRRVDECVKQFGYCVIVASEGIRDTGGNYITASHAVIDSFGHQQLGGVAPILAGMIKRELGHKYHWAVPDYLQRASKHIVSEVDYLQAEAVGREAVKFALAGESEVMVGIKRLSDEPYKWEINTVPISEVANKVKDMPRSYLGADGFSLSAAGIAYYLPLVQGEKYPVYENGVLKKASLVKQEIPAKLPPFEL